MNNIQRLATKALATDKGDSDRGPYLNASLYTKSALGYRTAGDVLGSFYCLSKALVWIIRAAGRMGYTLDELAKQAMEDLE